MKTLFMSLIIYEELTRFKNQIENKNVFKKLRFSIRFLIVILLRIHIKDEVSWI